MSKIILKILITLVMCLFIKCTTTQAIHNDSAEEQNISPGYKNASYAKESVEFTNLEFNKNGGPACQRRFDHRHWLE